MDQTTLAANNPPAARGRARNVCLCLAAAALAATLHSADPRGVLDLTAHSENESKSPGVPGASWGSIPRPHVSLPVEVTLLNLWPVVAASGDRMKVEIIIKNVGRQPVLIPASRNYAQVIKPGNHDQRSLGVGLKLVHKGTGRVINLVVGNAVGSSSVPDSVITLAPQETLLVRAANLLSETWKWEEEGVPADVVEIRAEVDEIFFEDDRYFVKARSAPAVSTNSMQIIWKHN